jgi:ligand-binding sensor domain-containing protein
MRVLGVILLFLVQAFSGGRCFGQNESVRFEHIGFGQGLSSETVISILQDSKGYIWFGTFDGLNKYDGYSFTKYRFDPLDTNSLSENFIYTIFEDKFGSIWVSTYDGLCRFDRTTETFTRYKPLPNEKFSDPNISSINEDNDGMMWVGNHSGGLCRFNRQTGEFLNERFDLGFRKQPGDKGRLRDDVTCIYKDRSGTLWVGNLTGLHKINLTITKQGQPSQVSFTHYQHDPGNENSLSSNVVASIFEDRAGIMWVATDNGLNSLDRKTGIIKRYQHDSQNMHSISSNNLVIWFGPGIKEDMEGNLWICTSKGLNKLNKERTIFTAYFHDPNDDNSISSDITMSLLIDKANILWAGALHGRLNKANLNHKIFGLIRQDPGNDNSLSNNEVTDILEDKEGTIWIGTYGGGLNRWDRKTNHFTHFRHNPKNPKTLKHDAVYAILEDHHGHLWISNGGFLSRLNKQTGEFTHYNSNTANYKDEDHRTIYSITEDQQGLLWLGTGNGLKNFDEKSGEFRHYYHIPGDTNTISDYTAINVYADSRDNIWVGYGSIATDRLDKQTGRFIHYKYDPHDPSSISSNIVNCFHEDSKGILWLGTSAGGLCSFDYQKEKFTTYTDKHGLSNNSVLSILEDNENHLWLGTGNGLSRFDPATKIFTNFDYKDGLQSNVFFAGDRSVGSQFRGQDGTLYVGGNNGFNFFDPLQLKVNSQVAPIVITQFKLFDKQVKGANESKEIVLDHNENYFSFEFSSLSFYSPDKNQYAYKLEGVDRDWVYSGPRHYVGYTNIDPGRYTFRVKGTNNDGVWNEEGTYITIIIKPPWWRTWWAYSIYAVLIVLAIWAIVNYRSTSLRRELERRKKEQQLTELQQQKVELEMLALRAQMNPHFIFNSLNSINMFILENNKLQASEYLSKFSKLIRLILQNSQEAFVPLEKELEALQLYLELESLRFDNKFEYKISGDDEIDTTALKVPPLIIQPYAENAIWHGLMHKKDKGHLEIELYLDRKILFCKITDDGIGRKKAGELKSKSASAHKSMGMKITESRMAAMKANNTTKSIEINDLVHPDGSPAGTEVTIKIAVHYD